MSVLQKQFYANTDLTPEKTIRLVQNGLRDADYGEFYHELMQTESIVMNSGFITEVSNDSDVGFGFRYGEQDHVGYTYSSLFNEKTLKRAISTSRHVRTGSSGTAKLDGYGRVNTRLYSNTNLDSMTLEQKIKRIQEIDAYIRSQSSKIDNVYIAYSAERKDVQIITPQGIPFEDQRPILTLIITITLKGKNKKLQTADGYHGGPISLEELFDQKHIERVTAGAIKDATTLLDATDAPVGTMDIVLSNGWPGILLHEAVGHGLEGDYNRRGISVYSNKIGQKIATDDVTIIDQGNIPNNRGSLHFDDEGTPGQKNILVENGILKSYMQDRQNALLMGVNPTGNGRRENYKYKPVPRMTNTYFANGKYSPEEIIASVKNGLYIDSLADGEVDTTSGKFNINANMVFEIKNGKIRRPFKGATLMGFGQDVIQNILMIGNDLEIPTTVGSCGKSGQDIVVGMGQPTIKVAKVKVGGLKR